MKDSINAKTPLPSSSLTPTSHRIHIGIYGAVNSGKSSVMNVILGTPHSIVSDKKGTTTDTVIKNIELLEAGPVTLLDTAGFLDTESIGDLRKKKTIETFSKVDLALVVLTPNILEAKKVKQELAPLYKLHTPLIVLLNKVDTLPPATTPFEKTNKIIQEITTIFNTPPYLFSALFPSPTMKSTLITKISNIVRSINSFNNKEFTKGLCKEGEAVILVMPQDREAPRARLIMPEVQVLRELLDKGCLPLCVTPNKLTLALKSLSLPPALVITDSQAFSKVSSVLPPSIPLTSFSILMAFSKVDGNILKEGIKVIDTLTPSSSVAIVESCSHTVLHNDIGRVKIPSLLKKKIPGLHIDFYSGSSSSNLFFSPLLSKYSLIIHCGACMLPPKELRNRVALAKEAGVAFTNYGIVLAYFSGILSRVTFPE